MKIGFKVACAADIADITVVGIKVLQERKEGTTILKGSVENVVIRYCTLTYMYQHIGPILRDYWSAYDLTACRCEDELVGRLWRAKPVKTHMIVAVQRSLVSGFIRGRIADGLPPLC